MITVGHSKAAVAVAAEKLFFDLGSCADHSAIVQFGNCFSAMILVIEENIEVFALFRLQPSGPHLSRCDSAGLSAHNLLHFSLKAWREMGQSVLCNDSTVAPFLLHFSLKAWWENRHCGVILAAVAVAAEEAVFSNLTLVLVPVQLCSLEMVSQQ